MSPLHGGNDHPSLSRDSTSATADDVKDPSNLCLKQHSLQLQNRTRNSSSPHLKFSALDYIFWKVLGEGSFSTVFLATDVRRGREFAIKVCEKRHIVKERKVEYIKREKDVMNIINSNLSTSCPFFVKLYHTFQDIDRLYFVMSYAKNSELLSYISDGKTFDNKCTQFYSAEILYALEHLHRLGIIHRDLKPENILLNEKMHVVLTDFGSAKILEDESLKMKSKDAEEQFPNQRTRSGSFVGTAQYVAPELLNDQSVSFTSDLWAMGCIIYQMVSGCPPFFGRNEFEIFQKIRKLELNLPDSFEPKAKDLVLKLLVLDASSRLGATDVGEYISVRSHELFTGVEFSTLHEKVPPLQPINDGKEGYSHDPLNTGAGPGLDNKQLSRLLGLSLHDSVSFNSRSNQSSNKTNTSISSILKSPEEMHQRLKVQSESNEWHPLVDGNLILRHGLVTKKKGLIAKKRILLLTTGPHLYYADPASRVLKGEVPWSSELREEAKNFKTFFIHTPEKIFRWDDPEGNALIWCDAIKQVRVNFYGN